MCEMFRRKNLRDFFNTKVTKIYNILYIFLALSLSIAMSKNIVHSVPIN